MQQQPLFEVPDENTGVAPEMVPDPHTHSVKNLDALAIDSIYELARELEELTSRVEKVESRILRELGSEDGY